MRMIQQAIPLVLASHFLVSCEQVKVPVAVGVRGSVQTAEGTEIREEFNAILQVDVSFKRDGRLESHQVVAKPLQFEDSGTIELRLPTSISYGKFILSDPSEIEFVDYEVFLELNREIRIEGSFPNGKPTIDELNENKDLVTDVVFELDPADIKVARGINQALSLSYYETRDSALRILANELGTELSAVHAISIARNAHYLNMRDSILLDYAYRNAKILKLSEFNALANNAHYTNAKDEIRRLGLLYTNR